MNFFFNKFLSLKHTSIKMPVLLVALSFVGTISFAQVLKDSCKVTLSSLEKKEESYYIVPANIVYPACLQKTEEETLEYIEKFSNTRRDYVTRMYNKGKKSFPKIIKAFKKYNLPQELKVLIALESAFNGNAVSGAGAVGYWQIMDEVAKEYGLKYIPTLTAEEKKLTQDLKKQKKDSIVVVKKVLQADDRKNFSRSTLAAARYLKDRSRNLNGDILLMVASYNCGIGNVKKAIEKSGKPNATFWDIKSFLPSETRNYVINFITLNVLFNNFENFSKKTLTFAPVKVKKAIENLNNVTAGSL